jgi:hypothetical protein
MKTTIALLIALVALTGVQAEEPIAPDGLQEFAAEERFIREDSQELIELAIALDTSDSMKSLIDAARLTLWDVVNELTLLDPPPQLRVALLSYGNSHNDRNSGYVRVELPLTTDLDLVSERLFALETKGGVELVGRTLRTAAEELDWSDSLDAVKLLFIAGNESAEQGEFSDLQEATATALEKELQLHTIFCGSPNDPNIDSWKAVAQSIDGQFASIDHRMAKLLDETPFDGELAELCAELNRTYLPMGDSGAQGQRAQAQQDQNALSMSAASAATRAQTKAGPLYAKEWDLVDALSSGRIDLYDLTEEELPEVMHTMTDGEREAYIEELAGERREIRERILALSAQRREHIAEKAEGKGIDRSRTFDGVIRRAIRQQVEEKGFRGGERD